MAALPFNFTREWLPSLSTSQGTRLSDAGVMMAVSIKELAPQARPLLAILAAVRLLGNSGVLDFSLGSVSSTVPENRSVVSILP